MSSNRLVPVKGVSMSELQAKLAKRNPSVNQLPSNPETKKKNDDVKEAVQLREQTQALRNPTPVASFATKDDWTNCVPAGWVKNRKQIIESYYQTLQALLPARSRVNTNGRAMPLPSLDEIQSIRIPAQDALVSMYEKNQDASDAEGKYKNYLRLVFNKSNEEIDTLIASLKSGALNAATQNAAAEKARLEAERLRLQQEAAEKARLEAERLRLQQEAAERARLEAERLRLQQELEKARLQAERLQKEEAARLLEFKRKEEADAKLIQNNPTTQAGVETKINAIHDRIEILRTAATANEPVTINIQSNIVQVKKLNNPVHQKDRDALLQRLLDHVDKVETETKALESASEKDLTISNHKVNTLLSAAISLCELTTLEVTISLRENTSYSAPRVNSLKQFGGVLFAGKGWLTNTDSENLIEDVLKGLNTWNPPAPRVGYRQDNSGKR